MKDSSYEREPHHLYPFQMTTKKVLVVSARFTVHVALGIAECGISCDRSNR